MSSNVSEFEGLYRHALVHPTKANLAKLVQVEDSKRPRIFIGRDETFILETQHSLLEQISLLMGGGEPRLVTDDNNRLGGDLIEANTGMGFELKLGSGTSANLGLATLGWALGVDEDKIRRLFVEEGTLVRRRLYLEALDSGKDPWPSILEHKKNMFLNCVSMFKTTLIEGEEAPSRLAHLCYAISRGVTQLEAIEQGWGDVESFSNGYLFQLKANGAFVLDTKIIPIDEKIMVEYVGMGSRGGGAQIKLRTSSRSIRILSHYKNSFSHVVEDKTIKIPAKAGVKAPCVNVWIK